jgi:hypothetical protein
MKKIIMAVLAALTLTGSAFAFGFKVDADGTYAGQVTFLNWEEDDEYIRVLFLQKSFGAGAGATIFLTDNLGISAEGSYQFSDSIDTHNWSHVFDTTTDEEDTVAIKNVQDIIFFAGLTYRIANEKSYYMITPGVSYSMVEFDNNTGAHTSMTTWGAGIKFEGGINITEKIAVHAGLLASYHFKPVLTTKSSGGTTSDAVNDMNWNYVIQADIVPKVGISIIF